MSDYIINKDLQSILSIIVSDNEIDELKKKLKNRCTIERSISTIEKAMKNPDLLIKELLEHNRTPEFMTELEETAKKLHKLQVKFKVAGVPLQIKLDYDSHNRIIYNIVVDKNYNIESNAVFKGNFDLGILPDKRVSINSKEEFKLERTIMTNGLIKKETARMNVLDYQYYSLSGFSNIVFDIVNLFIKHLYQGETQEANEMIDTIYNKIIAEAYNRINIIYDQMHSEIADTGSVEELYEMLKDLLDCKIWYELNMDTEIKKFLHEYANCTHDMIDKSYTFISSVKDKLLYNYDIQYAFRVKQRFRKEYLNVNGSNNLIDIGEQVITMCKDLYGILIAEPSIIIPKVNYYELGAMMTGQSKRPLSDILELNPTTRLKLEMFFKAKYSTEDSLKFYAKRFT